MTNNRLKKYFKKIVPPVMIRWITGLFYGWHGNYATWAEAQSKSSGYDQKEIAEKVKNASLKVKTGQASFERDSVVFDKPEYNYQLLSSLMWIAAQNKGELNVLDFGGALGSTYFQHKKFLDDLPDVNWCIVEQDHFVKEGIKHFQTDRLKFYHSIDECCSKYKIDVIFFSSVLQYLEKPYELMDMVHEKKIDYVIVDRTGYIPGNDRITIQKVHPAIYKATYPCWFFNKEKFLNFMNKKYGLVNEFDAFGTANIKSEFKGFIFKLKNY